MSNRQKAFDVLQYFKWHQSHKQASHENKHFSGPELSIFLLLQFLRSQGNLAVNEGSGGYRVLNDLQSHKHINRQEAVQIEVERYEIVSWLERLNWNKRPIDFVANSLFTALLWMNVRKKKKQTNGCGRTPLSYLSTWSW